MTAARFTTMITEYSRTHTTGIFRDHGTRSAGGVPEASAVLVALAGGVPEASAVWAVPVARAAARAAAAHEALAGTRDAGARDAGGGAHDA
jgi:hypothetical protein